MKQAIAFLESQRALGGTVLRPALDTAYGTRTPTARSTWSILSDGMTEQAEQSELVRLIRQRPSGSRVFCIGVGNEVNRPLLGQLANEAGGLAAFISQGDDFERQAEAFRRKLMRPAVSNLQAYVCRRRRVRRRAGRFAEPLPRRAAAHLRAVRPAWNDERDDQGRRPGPAVRAVGEDRAAGRG